MTRKRKREENQIARLKHRIGKMRDFYQRVVEWQARDI